MKVRLVLLSLVLTAALLSGCSSLGIGRHEPRTIHASDAFLSEVRPLTGFNQIDLRSIGKVLLSQGPEESVTVQGSENIVPLVETSVEDNTLVIETHENLDIVGLGKNSLTFIIRVKDLTRITVSGVAAINMDNLSTPFLEINLSGAGQVRLNGLVVESLKLTVDGVGNVVLAGEAASAKIVISGTSPLEASDLKVQTADVNISGLGSATLWVIGRLSGDISGAGSVSYYGEPHTSISASGLGFFNSLGSK